MSFLETILAAITTKAAAGVAAATLATGSVVVIAIPNEDEAEPTESLDVEDAEDAESEDDDLEPIPVATSEDEDEADDAEEGDLEEVDEPAEVEDDELWDLEGEGDDDQRSEVARAVHDALTGGEAVPGDPDFGQLVSDNARKGGLGQKVSEAARGARDADDDEASDDAGDVEVQSETNGGGSKDARGKGKKGPGNGKGGPPKGKGPRG